MPESFERREAVEATQKLLSAPAVESLSNVAQAKEVWDTSLLTHPEFLPQVQARQELHERLLSVTEQLPRPDVSLQQALEQGLVKAEQVRELYQSLTPLLQPGSEYQRLALYLPFEFLPSAEWQAEDTALNTASEALRQAYLAAWEKLLTVHDVRANFVDGDVLEIEARTGDLPRVVKAAHLIPKLVELGYLRVDEVVQQLKTATDPLLRQNILETLPVLLDLGLATPEELAEFQPELPQATEEESRNVLGDTFSPENLEDAIDKQLLATDTAVPANVSKKRAAWLYQEKERQLLSVASQELSAALANDQIGPEFGQALTTPETGLPSQKAFIDGLRLALEAKASTEPAAAALLYDAHRSTLMQLWSQEGLQDSLSKLFYHLQELGVVEEAELDDLSLTRPSLEGPFSENLQLIEKDLKEVRAIAKSIEQDPKLSNYIYPTVLVFGSRLKGYGAKNADLDVAVLVKPGTDMTAKEELRTHLASALVHEKIGGQAVEFWLEEKDGGLVVKDLPEYDPAVGESSWTHVLMGAAWEGEAAVTKELRNKLLAPYFFAPEKNLHERDARGLYLEELERDTLQYRLLHKGYEKFHPPYPGLTAPHAAALDGQSTFWDSGYRQMATKLFIDRVFIPKLTSEK